MRILFRYFISALSIVLQTGLVCPSTAFINESFDTSEAIEYYNKAEIFFKQAKYTSAYYYFFESGKIYENAGDWESYIRCLIKIGNIYIIKGEFDSVVVYLNNAESISKNSIKGDNIIFSELYHLKGHLLLKKGDYKESIKNLNRSVSLRINMNGEQDTILSLSYNNLGVNYYYLGEYDKALDYYKEALKIRLSKNTEPGLEVAKYYQNIGLIYRKKGDFDKAMDYYNKDMSISEKILAEDDPELANTCINIGVLYALLGKYDNALYYNKRAENIFVKQFGRQYYKLGTIYSNKAVIYKNKGEYEKAIRYYNMGLNILKVNYSSNHQRISNVYHNIGVVYYNKRLYEIALDYFRESISLKEKYQPYNLANTFNYFANCLSNLSKVNEADKYYNLAIANRIKYYGENIPELGHVYLNYGNFCIQNGNSKKGVVFYQKAYKIYFNTFGLKHPYTSICLIYTGDYWLDENDVEKALKYYQQALIAIVEDFDETDIYVNPGSANNFSDIQLLNILKKKAGAMRSFAVAQKDKRDMIKNMEMSLTSYEQAVELVDEIRTGYLNEESKLFLTGNEKQTFSETIETALELYKLTGNNDYKEKAFQYAERSKSANLLTSFRDIEAMKFGKIPDTIQNREKDIKRDIALYEDYIYREKQKQNPDQNKIDLWNSKLFELSREQERLITTIERQYPAYYELKYDTKVFDIKTLQSYLNKKEVLIEYVLTGDRLYIFVVTKDQFELYEEPVDSLFNKDIEITRNFISTNKYGNTSLHDYEAYQSSAFNLYLTVIKPCESLINEKKLIFVPDGKLAFIPFGALLYSFPDDNNFYYGDLPYLIKKYSVSYSYSATILFKGTIKNKLKNKKLLAFAPSYEFDYNKNSDNDQLYAINNIREDLVPIPGIKEEVNNISRLVKGVVFSGEEATERNFKVLSNNYNILHLAMHTVVDDERPMYSKLVFTQDEDSIEDGLLNTYEIYNMDINASMVVLSACKTGYGKLRRGEGIMSLARGFKYAGVPGIVMTLWSVCDDPSASLMSDFYKYLSKGKGKDEALRSAKLDYIQNIDQAGAHPYFWAGYVTIGDTKPVIKKNNISLIFILVGTGMLLSVLFFRKKFSF